MSKTAIGDYIYHRLLQLGIGHVFGVPGDFNLNLLDHIYSVEGITWVGTCNELNAAYAADGYARIRGKPGALITTYGVGELSAINGIAGAYSEHISIIHIVGMTSRITQEEKMMIHHTLDENWDHSTFTRMSEPVRSASAILDNVDTAAEEIDRVFTAAVTTCRPVYLFVPMDMPDIEIDGSRLKTPLQTEVINSSPEEEQFATEEILGALNQARNPCLLVDVLSHRYGLTEDVRFFAKQTKIRVSPLFKACLPN